MHCHFITILSLLTWFAAYFLGNFNLKACLAKGFGYDRSIEQCCQRQQWQRQLSHDFTDAYQLLSYNSRPWPFTLVKEEHKAWRCCLSLYATNTKRQQSTKIDGAKSEKWTIKISLWFAMWLSMEFQNDPMLNIDCHNHDRWIRYMLLQLLTKWINANHKIQKFHFKFLFMVTWDRM